ncbi:MAG TPA: T9SS type A sorting domain-containing protein [Puia sp.]|nr:T9SS type A sorting domain-containing protein [Puia sp.]
MKRLSCLFVMIVACLYVCHAQPITPSPDSGADLHSPNRDDPPFARSSAVVLDANKVWLQWDVDSIIDGDYFIVERSPDGQHFETIGALLSDRSRTHYELTDQAPPNGSDFYRIRYAGQDGLPLFSKRMELKVSGELDVKFYPNPVDKLFIVRSEHMVDIQIIDPAGTVWLSKRLQPGLQVVNATALERGVYVLRVTDKESNRAISLQLVKN